jgi:hypothetical protein
MIQIDGRFMPRVAAELSANLSTRVLGFDMVDGYSYDHVSDLYMGRPLLVVTQWQGTIEELFPSDVSTLLAEGFARTTRRYPADVKERYAAGDFDGAEEELIPFFHESSAPIDVRDFAVKALEEPEEAFCLEGDIEGLSTSMTRGVSFFMLSGLDAEPPSR